MHMNYKRWMMALLAGVLVLGLLAVPGCGTKEEPATEEPAASEPAAETPAFDARQAMIDAANEYFKSSPTPTIAAADPFKTIADDESLAKLDDTKKIVVVCYTGHTASMTNMVWNMLGYDALTLKFGMSGWVADKAIVGLDIPAKAAGTYPTVTTPTEAAGPFDAPELEGEYADAAEAIKAQAKAYFAKNLAPTIAPADVYNLVQAKDPGYQIVSVRKPEDYTKGHIDGAINVLWTEIADNLDKIDPDKKIVVYCYTGHTGGEAAMFLNLMG